MKTVKEQLREKFLSATSALFDVELQKDGGLRFKNGAELSRWLMGIGNLILVKANKNRYWRWSVNKEQLGNTIKNQKIYADDVCIVEDFNRDASIITKKLKGYL